jgi:hypothetical protein
MNKKINIKEIEPMLPNFISGNLSERDSKIVEEALTESPELNDLYLEFKKTFEFVSFVKFDEPPAQYWNTLLPRIHEKIETKKQSKLSFVPGYVWKVLLPAAALVLIFIIYKILTPPVPEMTKKQNVDTVKTIQTPEPKVKEPEIKQQITEVKKEKPVKQPRRTTRKSVPLEERKVQDIDVPQITKVELEYGRNEELASNEVLYNITSSVDDVEAIYEESEKEYENLSTAEKTEVLDKLKEIDL